MGQGFANVPLVTETYENFGGRNTKASVYLTGPREQLRLFNYDFSTPGDLRSRPGTSMYFGATFGSTGILGLSEYEKVAGYSKIFVGHPGGMWLGQDTTLSGISLGNMAAGQSLVSQGAFGTQLQFIPGASFGASMWDFSTMVDHHFFADGRAFLKFNGSTQTFWGLPDALPIGYVGTSPMMYSVTGSSVGTGVSPGFYYLAFAWLNERGFIGPARINNYVSITGTTPQAIVVRGLTFPINGYGITGLAMYTYFSPTFFPNLISFGTNSPAQSVIPFGTTIGFEPPRPDERFKLLAIAPVGASQFLFPNTAYDSTGQIPNGYVPFGQSNQITWGLTTTTWTQEQVVAPRFMEPYENQLFWAGESSNPSTVYHSDIDEPEGWNPEFQFDISTDDGDKVTCLKAFQSTGRLMIFKERSMHELTGRNPDNFVLRGVSTDYGAINNRCAVTFGSQCWFLDVKGICQYNGAAPEIVSSKVEDIFASMNLDAARIYACMLHIKERNEIWCAIPINGSTVNNCIVVYDYDVKAWAIWEGVNASYLARIKGRFSNYQGLFGDFQNRVNYFSPSLFGDNGSGISMMVQFRFEYPKGKSVENMFRRLFVDAQAINGSTMMLTANFRKDAGTSIQLSRTFMMTNAGIQNYMQFGIPGRALSVELGYYSATIGIQLHGYALHYRVQRLT